MLLPLTADPSFLRTTHTPGRHEIGHTLGLVHKGYKTKSENVTHEYYTIPPGTTLWGPTMGVPGMALFAQWSKGEVRVLRKVVA